MNLNPRSVRLPTNAESIRRAYEAGRLTDKEYAELLALEKGGHDVYCYGFERLASGGILNAWIIDTRIALPTLDKRWMILGADRAPTPPYASGDNRWRVFVRPPAAIGGNDVVVYFFVEPQPWYPNDDEAAYEVRARRRIASAIAHCGEFGIDPSRLADTYQ